MNYEQKNTSSDQGHEYQEKTRLVIDNWKLKQNMNTTGVDENEGNVPRFSIYILNIYSTLLVAQAISMVVA